MSSWQIMLIVNITPDSFSDGGKYSNSIQAIEKINKLQEQYPEILIDIGAESTNPKSQMITVQEEWERLEPVTSQLKNTANISIDTYKAEIARRSLEQGIRIINDVSGLDDRDMASLIASYTDSKIIINHHTGIPASYTPDEPQDNILDILKEYFEQKLKYAVSQGIKPEQIIIDPGLGFGKHTLDNYKIINNINVLKQEFDLPVLIGASRKRFIREYWGIEQQDIGTSVINALAINNGSDIIRTHNLEQALILQSMPI